MIPMTGWIETARTRLRPLEETDAEEAFAWFSDPEVMRYIPRGADAALDDTRSRIAGYRQHQTQFGFSKHLIIHRESGRPIGDAGLFHMSDGHRIELGYRLARPWWGAGYATEVARAWLDWCSERLKGRTLWADAHPDNTRSRQVLAKLGFTCSHQEPVLGMPMLIFWLSERISREPLEPVSPTMAVLKRPLLEPPLSLSFDAVTVLFSKILPGDAVRGFVPAYHWHITAGGVDVGHINLRVGNTEHVVRSAGHVGFEITPSFRGRRYALSACRALAPFARSFGGELIITCDPDNAASRRTIELLGAAYLDEALVPPHDPHHARGSKTMLRFRWCP
jgi:RimJ/RimL family protein N-acetyltransferase